MQKGKINDSITHAVSALVFLFLHKENYLTAT